jgi:preprotein translocase subunit Sss1
MALPLGRRLLFALSVKRRDFMDLTRFQLKTLRAFHSFRTERPTLTRLLAVNWSTVLQLAVIGVLGYLVALFLIPTAGWVIIGISAGSLCRDIARFRATVRAWPLYREIINWPRVSELVAETEN